MGLKFQVPRFLWATVPSWPNQTFYPGTLKLELSEKDLKNDHQLHFKSSPTIWISGTAFLS